MTNTTEDRVFEILSWSIDDQSDYEPKWDGYEGLHIDINIAVEYNFDTHIVDIAKVFSISDLLNTTLKDLVADVIEEEVKTGLHDELIFEWIDNNTNKVT